MISFEDAYANIGSGSKLAHSGKMAGKGIVIVDEDEIRNVKERIGVTG